MYSVTSLWFINPYRVMKPLHPDYPNTKPTSHTTQQPPLTYYQFTVRVRGNCTQDSWLKLVNLLVKVCEHWNSLWHCRRQTQPISCSVYHCHDNQSVCLQLCRLYSLFAELCWRDYSYYLLQYTQHIMEYFLTNVKETIELRIC